MVYQRAKSDSKSMCLKIIKINSNQKCNPEMATGMLKIQNIMRNTEIYLQY